MPFVGNCLRRAFLFPVDDHRRIELRWRGRAASGEWICPTVSLCWTSADQSVIWDGGMSAYQPRIHLTPPFRASVADPPGYHTGAHTHTSPVHTPRRLLP